MRYISTRGGAPEVGFIEAIMGGLAPDGGLYVPRSWPKITAAEIAAYSGRPYAEVAASILRRFTGEDLADDVVDRLCAEAYAGFEHPAVAPLVQLGPGLFLLELFHGPSLAFKDIAMQLLVRLYDHVLAASGRVATIVCATSGDTGGAAVEAFRGLAAVRLVVLFPAGRISEVQRRFMTTADEANVRIAALDGDFDDCQAILKALFADDEEFVRNVRLTAVNSINLARIIAQTVYYFTAAAALGSPAQAMTFAVPTGNFGDAYAGHAAAAMGLPVERLIVATNANDIVARALEHGRYERGPTQATTSPAMDIQVASNFERLWFECSGRDSRSTAAAFQTFARTGSVDIPEATLGAMREFMGGVAISDRAAAAMMRATFEESGMFIDPHTAVALAGARAIADRTSIAPTVVLSTAHPAKFPEAVRAATGVAPPVPARVLRLQGLKEKFDALPARVETVKAYVRSAAA
jgi:threonine synthase